MTFIQSFVGSTWTLWCSDLVYGTWRNWCSWRDAAELASEALVWQALRDEKDAHTLMQKCTAVVASEHGWEVETVSCDLGVCCCIQLSLTFLLPLAPPIRTRHTAPPINVFDIDIGWSRQQVAQSKTQSLFVSVTVGLVCKWSLLLMLNLMVKLLCVGWWWDRPTQHPIHRWRRTREGRRNVHRGANQELRGTCTRGPRWRQLGRRHVHWACACPWCRPTTASYWRTRW